MRLQSRSTTSYVFKNFVFILPFVVIPALLLAFFQPQQGPLEFFADLYEKTFNGLPVDFSNFYESLYGYFSFVNIDDSFLPGVNMVWIWLVVFAVTLFCVCLATSFVERHIRFGTRKYLRVLRSVNEVVMYIMPFVVLMVVVFEVLMLILCGLIVLLSQINGIAFYVISVFLAVIFYEGYFVVAALTLLTPPCMFFDGYKFSSAIGYSMHLSAEHFREMFLGILLPIIVSQVLLAVLKFLVGLLPSESLSYALTVALKFLFYLWWLVYLPCLSCCKYADFTEMKRADLKLKIFG